MQARVRLAEPKGNPLWKLSLEPLNPEAAPLLVRAADWDRVYDARSPGEFKSDHIPGAISTAVLDDEERKEVGTLYQSDSFRAKRLGASLVAKNLATILGSEEVQSLPWGSKILVYCYRGGERSNSLAHTLSRVGWRVCLVEGGYKAHRASVLTNLARSIETTTCVNIAGRTGSAKGLLLEALKARGAQTLDLEGLACHKGSALGDLPDTPQPSQKRFETLLAYTLADMDPNRPIYIEAESSRVGVLAVPPALFRRMKAAPVVEVTLPMEERVKWIRRGYKHFETTHVSTLLEQIEHCVPSAGRQAVDGWRALIDAGQWGEFVKAMLEEHYDAAYGRAYKGWAGMAKPALALHVPRADSAAMDDAATSILETFEDGERMTEARELEHIE